MGYALFDLSAWSLYCDGVTWNCFLNESLKDDTVLNPESNAMLAMVYRRFAGLLNRLRASSSRSSADIITISFVESFVDDLRQMMPGGVQAIG